MNKTWKVLAIWLALALLTMGWAGITSAAVSYPDKEEVVKGNNTFAFDLYAKLKGQEGNLFFSPYSISTALAMTYAGARGNTQKQMAKVLHLDLDQKRLHPAFAQLQQDLIAAEKKGGYQLSVANALWGQKGYQFLKEFLNLTRQNYGAALREVDFVKATEKTRQIINAWVERETKGKIKDLIKPGLLNPLTRLVLTNAIYFKGNWASQFDEKLTQDAPFTVTRDKKIKVPMMYQKGEFKYREEDNLQALELPYVNNELSMVILLPKKVDSLTELEKQLSADKLKKWLENLHRQEVKIYLPKFKMTSEFSLANLLQSMGMTDAFSLSKADFSGMTGRKDLFISAVIHKAFVDVNEEGTEAAAATGVGMKITAVPKPPPVFRADHPFIFLIRDNQSGSILFLGRVMNPMKST